MVKRIMALFSVVAMLILLTSCSAQQGENVQNDGKQTPIPTVGEAKEIKNNVTIAPGQKAMDEGLDFGGKSFKLAIPFKPGDEFDRKVADFNEKFNANVETTVVNWDDFNMSLATAQQSGATYDIIFFHAQFFPGTIDSDLLQPLETTYTTADLFDPAKEDAGGLNPTISNAFAWNNHTYAVGSIRSVFPEIMYYNKKLFSEAGLDDPMELYNKGEWTWDKIREMSKSVYDESNGTYFLGGLADASTWLGINNVSAIAFDGSKPRNNLKDAKLISAMNSFKDLFYGDEAMCSHADDGSDGDRFNTGKLYCLVAVTDAYHVQAGYAKSSNAFEKNIDNLGLVPVPYMTDEKLYPVHAAQGWASGNGSDPRVAVAFAKFESTWIDTADVADAFPQEMRKTMNDILNKGLYIQAMGFQNNDGKDVASILNYQLGKKIYQGGDVAAILTQYEPAIQKCVVDSTAQQ